MTEGARGERLQSYQAGIAVDLDPEAEGLEDRAAQLGVGLFLQRLGEVGNGFENRRAFLDVQVVAVAVAVELGDKGLDLLALCFQDPNPLADNCGIDARLDRGELPLDPAVHVGELVACALALGAAVALLFRREGRGLPAEVLHALGAEDAGAEEGVDQRDQVVLADVLPFAVAGRLCGGVAIGAAVAAGVIGVALAALALHPQRVVAGGAVDDAAQQVEALLLAASAVAAVAGAARLHLHLHALEVLL